MRITFLLIFLAVVFGVCSGYLLPTFVSFLPQPLISPIATSLSLPERKSIGFLPYWLMTKAQPSYSPYLTDLAYFSLTVRGDGTIERFVRPGEEEPGFTTLKKETTKEVLRKAKNDGLVTSLTVFMSDESAISELLENPEPHAQTIISEITPLFHEYGFTDLNLDIESVKTASASGRRSFTQLVKTLKNELVKKELGTLTVELTVASLFNYHVSDPVEIGAVADTIVLMTYDYHYPGSLLSGPIAPIGGTFTVRANDVRTSLLNAIQKIPKEKVVMGIPLYGYEWETVSGTASAAVIPGTGQTASDHRVEELLATCTNCKEYWDTESEEPYLLYPEASYYTAIVYTNSQAIESRLRLSKELGLGGVAFWALGYEGSKTLGPVEHYKTTRLLPN